MKSDNVIKSLQYCFHKFQVLVLYRHLYVKLLDQDFIFFYVLYFVKSIGKYYKQYRFTYCFEIFHLNNVYDLWFILIIVCSVTKKYGI